MSESSLKNAYPQSAIPEKSDPAALATLARRGSATAFVALSNICQSGKPQAQEQALRLLPGLVPIQPVWNILDQCDHPGTPPMVREVLRQIRPLCDDAVEHQDLYRTAQSALVSDFIASEREALPRSHSRTAYLRTAEVICNLFYDYRFTWSDGALYGATARHVEEFLLDYAPRYLLLEHGERLRAPHAISRHASWLGKTGLLLEEERARIVKRCEWLRPVYADRLRMPAPGSQANALHAAGAAGIDLSDEDALKRFLTLEGLDLNEELAPIWEGI